MLGYAVLVGLVCGSFEWVIGILVEVWKSSRVDRG